MKYCMYCGNKVLDDTVICLHCGNIIGRVNIICDSVSITWTLIAFLFPPLGVLLGILWHNSRPLRTKSVTLGLKMFLLTALTASLIFITFNLI